MEAILKIKLAKTNYNNLNNLTNNYKILEFKIKVQEI